MNKYFYCQPRNLRLLSESAELEGCQPRISLKPDMRCGIAVSIGLGVAGAVISSDSSSSSQKNSSELAAYSQKKANDQNYKMFEESRGKTGSAVLPLYLGGGLFESSLGNDLISAYNGSNVPLSTFQDAVSGFAPAEAKAKQFTNDIFNGGVTSKLLAEAQPVEQARTSSAMDALSKTLASIDAAQAGKGFSGDSYGNRMLQFRGREAVGNANVANLAENQQIENYGNVTLPMNNLNLPGDMANKASQFAFLPQNDYLQSLQSRIQPLNFLKIGTGNPPPVQPLPTPPPTAFAPSALGAAFSGAGQVVGAGLNYYMNRPSSTAPAGTNYGYNGSGAGGNSYMPGIDTTFLP